MVNNEVKVESVQISSGGFIFYFEKETQKLFVLLIRNRKGEFWIPKGKLEKGEDQITAAFREIEEEVGLTKQQIKYIDFCFLDKYTYIDSGKLLGKELYINVFEADRKYVLKPEDGEIDITNAEWHEYEEALKVISFNKNELVLSRQIFENITVSRNMSTEIFINSLKEEILIQSFCPYLECFIIFGSYVYSGSDPKDVDICVVLNNRNANVQSITGYIYSRFENPDITLYFKDELLSGIPFTDIGNGIFAIEYLSYGVAVYGDNFFKELFQKINKEKYKESLLQKAFEYVLRLRVVYYSNKSEEEKKNYFYKYVFRLSKSLLLFLGEDYFHLMKLSNGEIVELLDNRNIIKTKKEGYGDLQSLFFLYEELNMFLLTLKL